MLSYLNKLAETPELLENKNQLKRFLLKQPDYADDSAVVMLLLKALDADIVPWFKSGNAASDIEKAVLINKLISGGIDEKRVYEVYDTWEQMIKAVYPDAVITEKVQTPAVGEELFSKPVYEPYVSESVNEEISFVNPVLPGTADDIYIPCGFGKTDHGFFIKGITKQVFCEHKSADIYALVYNMLVRNTLVSDTDFPDGMCADLSTYTPDYKSIYRLAIVLLQLIRHNYVKNENLTICFQDSAILVHAVWLINYYAALFSKIAGVPAVKLNAVNGARGIPVSLDAPIKNGIYIENNTGVHSPAREIWYGRKIQYHLRKENLPEMEKLLSIVSPFHKFREGQYEALCKMLASKSHCVCIMPTGSGKSLIYYLASLLQPLPLFVVAPTDILIEDQIRNLSKFHNIDNVSHLQLTTENSFKNFEIPASINYLTPTTLQTRNLLMKFRYINNGTHLVNMREERIAIGPLASYIVLDEIHCLSNWGHDFRPEYLMLSKYLNTLLSQVTFWGFTATANYTVVEDVQKQLRIPQENFFSPVAFEKYNVSYYFYQVDSTKMMHERLKEITDTLIQKNERTIVFTKNDEISRQAAETIGYEADIFSRENPYAYHHFVDGKCKILVASEELGIGINFPDIRNIIHFGLPLSKNEYVQEVGRAGRANEQVKSYVIFLENTEQNISPRLLRRDTDINEVPLLLKEADNDYTDIYRKLTNDCPTKDKLYERLTDLIRSLDYHESPTFIRTAGFSESNQLKQQLFMLRTLGYVYDWYAYDYNEEKDAVDILIDVCSADTASYRQDPRKMFARMQQTLSDYFDDLDDSREAVAKANRARNQDELVRVYVDWYYSKYLYHHNEQFIDLYEFITGNMRSDSDKITGEIKDYFVLPFIKIKTDEAYYLSLSNEEIIEKALVGIGRETLTNLERINSNRYSEKIDLLLFCGHFRMNGTFEPDRLKRVLSHQDRTTQKQILAIMPKLYGTGKIESKLELLKYIEKNPSFLNQTTDEFIRKAYETCDKDLIYYGLAAQRLNRYFNHKGVRL